MTRSYEIVDATFDHVRDLRGRLRPLDQRECIGSGVPLYRSFRRSLITRAALSEGRVIAMWGMGGEMLSNEGRPWFLTAAEVERFPVAMVREARYAVEEMLGIRPYLWNYVLDEYAKAVKFVSLLGFSIDQPLWASASGDRYRRFWIRR